MSERTIVLTGGTGFLGRRLLSRLVGQGDNVVLLKRSNSPADPPAVPESQVTAYGLDCASVDAAFAGRTVDAIVHCATDYGRGGSPPAAIVEANVVFPLRLLEIAEKRGIRTFLNIDTNLDPAVSDYALSKEQFEDWLFRYSDRIGCANIALEHFFGPEGSDANFITHIARKLLMKAEYIDLTAGEQERDFIYIDDVVDAIVIVLRHCENLGPGLAQFEVGSGAPIEVRKLVLELARLAENTQTALRFGALPYRKNEVWRSHANLEAITQLGWKPKVPLHEGLSLTIEHERRAMDGQNVNTEKGGAW